MSATLADEQQALLAALWAPSDALALAGVGRHLAVSPTGLASPLRGLQSYRAGGLALAQRALPAAFPVLTQLVGDESMAALAADFWRHHPPVRGDVAQWGGALPGFVRAAPSLADTPYLADVAAVEWALHRAATAADPQPDLASFALLVQIEPAAVTLVLPDGTDLIHSPWPVVSLIQAHGPDGPPLAAVGERLRRHAESGEPVSEIACVWRQGYRPRVREAPAAEADFLAALRDCRSLGAALDAAPGLDFQAWLGPAVQDGLVVGVRRLD